MGHVLPKPHPRAEQLALHLRALPRLPRGGPRSRAFLWRAARRPNRRWGGRTLNTPQKSVVCWRVQSWALGKRLVGVSELWPLYPGVTPTPTLLEGSPVLASCAPWWRFCVRRHRRPEGAHHRPSSGCIGLPTPSPWKPGVSSSLAPPGTSKRLQCRWHTGAWPLFAEEGKPRRPLALRQARKLKPPTGCKSWALVLTQAGPLGSPSSGEAHSKGQHSGGLLCAWPHLLATPRTVSPHPTHALARPQCL